MEFDPVACAASSLWVKHFFSRTFALTFAAELYGRLQKPAVLGTGGRRIGDTGWFRAAGGLPLCAHDESGEIVVPVDIHVTPHWMTIPPLAIATPGFLRAERDWHVQPDGCLCYVLAHEWKMTLDCQFAKGLHPDHLMDFAATWCLSSLDSLLVRHLIGHRFGFTKWPQRWAQWAHGPTGTQEYQRYKCACRSTR